MVLKPVSCDNVASFNCDDKKTSVLGLTCWCHMSNIMPDFFFHERIWQRLTCFIFFMYFVFCQCCCPFSMDWYFCFHWWSVMKWWNQFYHHNISGYEAILSQTSADEIYEHSVRFEVWMMSGCFRLKISLGVSFVSVCCVGFNQECYVSIQYSLLKDCCERFLI